MNTYDALNEQRVLVLMEFGDHFQQVYLTSEEYKKLSDLISIPYDNEEHEKLPYPNECRHLAINEDWKLHADNFLGLNSVNDEENTT